jgi:excisionase family DNA binding protein
MTGPFVPIEEVAKHFTVSVSTIRAWVRQGHIPKDTYIKVGNTYRFSIDNVAAALTKRETEAPAVAVASGTGAVAAVAMVSNVDDEVVYGLDEDM